MEGVKKVKQLNRNLLKLAVICVGIQDMGAGAAAPAIASMLKEFSDVSPSLVMQVVSIPIFCMALFSPLYAKLTTFLRKRTILYIASALFIFGGIMPAFSNNIYMIIFMRIVFGASIGFFMPLAADLVMDFFEGDERATVLGWSNAIAGLGGVFFAVLGGILANYDWHYCFFAYGASIIFLVTPLFILPEPDKKEKLEQQAVQDKAKLPSSVYWFTFCLIIYNICIMVFVSNVSSVILGDKLGTPGDAGVAMAYLNGAATLSALLFGPTFKILKNYTIGFAYLLIGIGLLLFYFAPTLLMLQCAIFVSGWGMGYAVPGTVAKIATLVPYSKCSAAISCCFFGIGFGAFLSPFVCQGIYNMTNSGPGRVPFTYAAGGMLIVAIIAMIISNKYKPVAENPNCTVGN